MKILPLTLIACAFMMAGCETSKKNILASESQVEQRSYQTRTFDMSDKKRMMRTVMATLQDLGFVINKADDVRM